MTPDAKNAIGQGIVLILRFVAAGFSVYAGWTSHYLAAIICVLFTFAFRWRSDGRFTPPEDKK